MVLSCFSTKYWYDMFIYPNYVETVHSDSLSIMTFLLFSHRRSLQSDQDPCCSLSVSLLEIEMVSEQHGSWSDCTDAQSGLDPCWSQTHFVGFVVTRLIFRLVNVPTSVEIYHLVPSIHQHEALYPLCCTWLAFPQHNEHTV
jgi:hypothetical protein